MSLSESHICPNCGAPLVRRSFIEMCLYCGYFTAVSSNIKADSTSSGDVSPQERYVYFTRQLSYIQMDCPVEVIKVGDSYNVRAKGTFSPNDGKKMMTDIILRYQANLAEDTFTLQLKIESKHDEIPAVYIKTNSSVFIPEVVLTKGYYTLMISDALFCSLCEADDIDVDTNLILTPLIWKELKTYSRRFYHSIINRQRYVYSVHQKLIIDKTN